MGRPNRARGPFPNRGGTRPWRQPRRGVSGLTVLGLPAASTGEGRTRSTRELRLTSLMGRRGRRLTRGAGNDDYDVRKVPRRPAQSRGVGRGERRRGANQSLVVERTRRLLLDADIVAVAWGGSFGRCSSG
jgi:hypothetical protein